MNVAQPKNFGILVLIVAVALLAGCAQAPSVERASGQENLSPNAAAALPPPWHEVYSGTAAYIKCDQSGAFAVGVTSFGITYKAPPASELANASMFHLKISWTTTPTPVHYNLGTQGQLIQGTSSTSPVSIDVPASTIHPLANYFYWACPQAPVVNGGAFALQDVAADISYS